MYRRMNYIISVNLFVSIFLILFTFSLGDSLYDLCKEKHPCRCTLDNGTSIDLSALGKDDNIPLFYDVPYMKIDTIDNTAEFEGLYSYKPCYDFTEIRADTSPPEDEVPCKNAAACKFIPGTADGLPPQLYAIGTQANAVFYQDDDNYYRINYTVPSGESNLTVRLICNKSVEHSLSVDSPIGVNHMMNLTTKCACPGECASNEPVKPAEHGLSTGSILLITFFTILLVYVFGGVLWNFCNGAHGIGLLPHSAFWSDVPQLIVDGFLYTCSFCSSKRSQSTYSDM